MKNKISKAVHLTYNIKSIQRGEGHENQFQYDEYFIPYSNAIIKKSPFFSLLTKESQSLIDKFPNKKIDFISEEYIKELKAEDKIIPETIDILMDAICCFVTPSFEERYYYYYRLEDLYYELSNIFKESLIHKEISPIQFVTNYIWLYTELIKYEVEEKKFLISILIHLYNESETENDKDVLSLYKEVVELFSLNDTTVKQNIGIKKELENQMLYICTSTTSIYKQKVRGTTEFDIANFDRFISLLKKYQPIINSKANFIQGHNCFCLTREGNNYYFSLSGYKDDYGTFAGKIKNDLQSYFPNRNFYFCKLCDDTLSYNIPSYSSICHRQAKSLGIKKLSQYYSCCERKIFPSTIDYSKKLIMLCKYQPCNKCIPAVNDQKTKRLSFFFYALVKDYKAWKKIMSRNANLFLPKSGIYTLYQP